MYKDLEVLKSAAAAALVTLSAGCNAGISLAFLKVRRSEFVG
jgi:hypothetical protein